MSFVPCIQATFTHASEELQRAFRPYEALNYEPSLLKGLTPLSHDFLLYKANGKPVVAFNTMDGSAAEKELRHLVATTARRLLAPLIASFQPETTLRVEIIYRKMEALGLQSPESPEQRPQPDLKSAKGSD